MRLTWNMESSVLDRYRREALKNTDKIEEYGMDFRAVGWQRFYQDEEVGKVRGLLGCCLGEVVGI
jgi:hypothetical protein